MKPSVTIITSLFRCSRYLQGFLEAASRIDHADDVELLLLHNEPSEAEMDIIRRLLPTLSLRVRHIVIPEREGLYRTWNRGVDLAEGEFIAVWNVDDVRTPESLKVQAQALRTHPEAALCYGSYIGVQEFGVCQGVLYQFPQFTSWRFGRSCYLTPFPMWRKSMHQTIGHFDEGFRSAGDYDFQLRLAHAAPFVRVDSVVGYYLEAPETGISKSGDINNIERTVCELRYGIFDKVNVLYLRKASRYSLQALRWSESVHYMHDYYSNYNQSILIRLVLAPAALVRIPINVLRYIKHRILPRLREHKAKTQRLAVSPNPLSH